MSQDTKRLFKTFGILFNAISVVLIIRLLTQFRWGYIEFFVMIEDIIIAICFVLLIVNNKKIEKVTDFPEFSSYVKMFMISAILLILGNISLWVGFYLIDPVTLALPYQITIFANEALNIVGTILQIIAWIRLWKYGKGAKGGIKDKMTYGLGFGPIFLILGSLIHLSFVLALTADNVLYIMQGTGYLTGDLLITFLMIRYLAYPFIAGFGYSGFGYCVKFIPHIEELQYGLQANTGNDPTSSAMFEQPTSDTQDQSQPQFNTDPDVCPQCGVKYAPDSRFCQNCGAQRY